MQHATKTYITNLLKCSTKMISNTLESIKNNNNKIFKKLFGRVRYDILKGCIYPAYFKGGIYERTINS